MTTKVSSSVIGDRSVGALQLANTAITAGTYGGTSNIPYIIFDAQGRAIGAGNATPSIANTNLSASGTANSTTFLRGDNTWASVTAESVSLGSTANVQFGSIGVGQAASGVSGEIKATKLYANVAATNVTFGDSTVQTSAPKKVLITKGDITNTSYWTMSCGTWADYSEIEIAYEFARTSYSSSTSAFAMGMHVNSVQRQFAYQMQTYSSTSAQALMRSSSSYDLWLVENASNNYTGSGIQPLVTGRVTIRLPELNNTNISPAGIFIEASSWFPPYVSSDTVGSRNIQASSAIAGTIFSSITNSMTVSVTMRENNSVAGYGKYVVYGIKR